MSDDIKFCEANDTLDRAAGLMWNHDIGSLPVVDSERRVIGMVTDRDVCMAAYTQGKRLDEIPVSSVMSTRVLSVGPDENLGVAEKLMREGQVRRIPVLDFEGRLIGLVSQNDFLREAADNQTLREEITSTVAAIGRPRGNSHPSFG
jgi:CBS domain-containing protein